MPIYEYLCTSCQHRFDLRQGFDADPVARCPHCGKDASRQFGAVAVIYKGSGFYTTDYKRKSFSPASSNGSKEDSGGQDHDHSSAASTSDSDD